MLRWHRELVARRWTHPHTGTGRARGLDPVVLDVLPQLTGRCVNCRQRCGIKRWGLIEASLSGQQIVWRLGGMSETELRELVVACVGLAAIFCRAASVRGKVQPTETIAWVRERLQ